MILDLHMNEFLRLSGARGTTVEVLGGRVWITEAGRALDTFVAAGMRYRVAGNGLVVVGAETAADRRSAPHASRIAVHPPLWRWLRVGAALLAQRLRAAWRERRTATELEALSDRALRDIGLRRADIPTAARRRGA